MNLIRMVVRLLLGRRLVVTEGSLNVPGPHQGVRIHRDRWGIPLIEAGDEHDAHFALGFCHGQDRAFQMEFLKRVAGGTLSALVGGAALPVDRLARRIGFRREAARQWPLLSEQMQGHLTSYAQGATQGMRAGCPRAPHEFAFLGARPSGWEALDTLAVVKLLSFTLCSNWDVELARLRILSADGPAALEALDPTYPAWHPVIKPVGQEAGQVVDYLARDLAHFFNLVAPGGGSNNWALAASRTSTGRPILACDPHLDASLPGHWYLACVRTPRGALAGASFVGGPSFLVAHNGHAAWGLTAGLVDNTDLFREEVGPDGASVRQGDSFVPCPVAEEVIAVKGGAPVTERVLLTPRGPIVSPVLPDAKEALSLRASWLDPGPIDGLLGMREIRSFADFRRAFAHWPAAAQNMVYADVSGVIGWQLIGRTPRRKEGFGTLPLPGWDARAGWEDEPVPYEDMPHLQDPPCGYLATANNKPVRDGEGPFLGLDFIDGYRAKAILQALEARSDWDVPSTMRLQMSQRAPAWQEMREVVLAAPASNPHTERALELLRGWDGEVSAGSPAAAVYELFLVEMAARAARVKAPHSAEYALGKPPSVVTTHAFLGFRRTAHLVGLLRTQPAGWFAEGWPEAVSGALAAALRTLEAQRGPEVGRWAWGEVRPLTMRHPLTKGTSRLGRALAQVFNVGPVPCGGDADVINQAAVLPHAPLAHADNIPSLRAVFDVGAWSNSRFVLPGGQSGNPFSPHYADLFDLWRRGEGVPIAFTEEEVRAAAVQTLELRPAPGQ